MSSPRYRGRFAPSPTGTIHIGTLTAAVGSYLRARSCAGEWLLRIEDVDITRSLPGAADAILRSLDTLGFEWDGEVIYQSQRSEHYAQALAQLQQRDLVYACTCSRRQLAQSAPPGTVKDGVTHIYPGTCRQRKLVADEEHALRLRVTDDTVAFDDVVMGACSQQLGSECGDFVIRRRDRLFAYQLAVVVDDALQGVTEVVRGVDLIDSTPRQIYLQRQLGYAQPAYVHLPLVIDEYNMKLGKSTGGAALDLARPAMALHNALGYLGHRPPPELANAALDTLWQWAFEHWDVNRVPRQNQRLT